MNWAFVGQGATLPCPNHAGIRVGECRPCQEREDGYQHPGAPRDCDEREEAERQRYRKR